MKPRCKCALFQPKGALTTSRVRAVSCAALTSLPRSCSLSQIQQGVLHGFWSKKMSFSKAISNFVCTWNFLLWIPPGNSTVQLPCIWKFVSFQNHCSYGIDGCDFISFVFAWKRILRGWYGSILMRQSCTYSLSPQKGWCFFWFSPPDPDFSWVTACIIQE